MAGTAVCLSLAGTLTPAWGVGGPSYDVVATGLNNPRGLTATRGALYVAESGIGSGATCNADTAGSLINSEGNVVCPGNTGSIARVSWQHGWRHAEVVTGLPSLAADGGGSATGPAALLVNGRGQYVLSMGLGLGCGTEQGASGPTPTGPDPACHARADHQLSPLFGTLVTGTLHHGRIRIMADLAAHEWVTNPVDNPDSNPGGVAFARGRYAVADAGGNTLVEVRGRHVRTLAAFPDQLSTASGAADATPVQQVPTAVVWHDGAFYVSTLTGFPFPVGGASIYRVVPGHAPEVYAAGLTNVTGLAFGRHGTLYAVQIAAQGLLNGPIGSVVAIAPGGRSMTTIAQGLFAPYGIAVQGDDLYVTTGSVLPGAAPNATPTDHCAPAPLCTGGEVVRIPLQSGSNGHGHGHGPRFPWTVSWHSVFTAWRP